MKFLTRSLLLLYSMSALGQTVNSPSDQWSRKHRLDYIQSTLVALSSYSPDTIANAVAYINFANKTSCRSSIYELKVQCFLAEIEKKCSRFSSTQCRALYDIIAVNKLSERRFISNRERFRLYKKHGTTEGVLQKTLNQRYGQLATGLKLSPHLTCLDQKKPCFVEGLDRFCLDVSDRGQYPWQTCVGALVWFVTQP